MKTVQGTHGLLSTSEWTGVQFATIAREVGLKDGATWVLAEGADAAVMTRSIPMEKMLKDALIVYGQNGEALRPEQGYPLRLLAARLRGQHAHQMVAPHGSQRQAVHDTGRDVQIHGPAGQRKGPPVQHGDGGEVRHHLSRRAT